MEPYIVIDNYNFKDLVRSEISKYVVSITYANPRQTKKGYLGMKHKGERFEFATSDQALEKYHNLQEIYVPMFDKKTILALYINYSPIINYWVECPKCHKNAEILSWVISGTIDQEGWVSSSPIICIHCAKSQDIADQLTNTVGECHNNLFGPGPEEKNISLRYHNTGIKWENWEDNITIEHKSER